MTGRAVAMHSQRRLDSQLNTLPHDELPPDDEQHPLQARLEQSETRAFELEETLAAAREELDAVREINRELLSQHNRTAG